MIFIFWKSQLPWQRGGKHPSLGPACKELAAVVWPCAAPLRPGPTHHPQNQWSGTASNTPPFSVRVSGRAGEFPQGYSG